MAEIESILIEVDCKPSEKLLLLIIAKHGDFRSGNGGWPSTRRLAALSGLSRSTVDVLLSEMKARGWLSWISGEGRKASANVYTLHVESMPLIAPMNERHHAARQKQGIALALRPGPVTGPSPGPISGPDMSRPGPEPGPITGPDPARFEPLPGPVTGPELKPNTKTELIEHREMLEAKQMWAVASGRLRDLIARHSWDTWIRPARGRTVRDHELIVEFPSPAFGHVPERWPTEIEDARQSINRVFPDAQLERIFFLWPQETLQ